MSCDELFRHLVEWEDGVLPEDFCRALEGHLRDCPPCADLHADLRRLSALCLRVPRPEMPADLREKLRALLAGC
jgi:anti-sigma factor RsiW